MAVPETVLPAAAFSPAQVGAGRDSNLNLGNSNLLTEVDSGSYWRKRRPGSNKFDGRYYRKHSYNSDWKYKKHHRHHRRHHNDFPYGLAFGLALVDWATVAVMAMTGTMTTATMRAAAIM